MTVLTDETNSTVPAPGLTQEQLIVMYIAILEQQISDLKETVSHQNEMIETQNEAIELICDDNAKRLIEIHAEHNATKEKLNQAIKKDEMKTALLKQMMKKK
jgi:pentose-5-phosphate-3-epimerase